MCWRTATCHDEKQRHYGTLKRTTTRPHHLATTNTPKRRTPWDAARFLLSALDAPTLSLALPVHFSSHATGRGTGFFLLHVLFCLSPRGCLLCSFCFPLSDGVGLLCNIKKHGAGCFFFPFFFFLLSDARTGWMDGGGGRGGRNQSPFTQELRSAYPRQCLLSNGDKPRVLWKATMERSLRICTIWGYCLPLPCFHCNVPSSYLSLE